MTGIIDYAAGNVRSIINALERLGEPAVVGASRRELAGAERIILPGVGAAGEAMARLRERELVPWIVDSGRPLLGICLGMQLLHEHTEEQETDGIGLFPGTVARMSDARVKVPHVGWNRVRVPAEHAMFAGIPSDTWMYFVHSYRCPVTPASTGITIHEAPLAAAVARDRIWGVQFHPERSGAAGLTLLRNFIELC